MGQIDGEADARGGGRGGGGGGGRGGGGHGGGGFSSAGPASVGFPRVAGSVPWRSVAHRAAMESAVAERGLQAGRRSGRRA